MTDEKRKELAAAVQRTINTVYQVEHRLNHAIAAAEMYGQWPMVVDKETVLRDRAALTKAMTILAIEILPALQDEKQ